MIGLGSDVWMKIGPLAVDPFWRALFLQPAEEMCKSVDQLHSQLMTQGVDGLVATAYLTYAPLYHERGAIHQFTQQQREWRDYLPEITTPSEACRYAIGEYRLSASACRELVKLLSQLPAVLFAMAGPALTEADWTEEAYAIDLMVADFNVARHAVVPGEDYCVEELYDADDEKLVVPLDQILDEVWNDPVLLLAMEQCALDGQLMPTSERALKLMGLPPRDVAGIERLFSETEPTVLAAAVNYAYWLVRSERLRRTGRSDLVWQLQG